MINIVGISSRFIADLLRLFKDTRGRSAVCHDSDPPNHGTKLDGLAAEALTIVFGMNQEGRIKKEKVIHVVEKLGLINGEEDRNGFELLGESAEELRAEEVMGEAEKDELRRMELLLRAFTVFDEDGDGFIQASEVKRILECLGLGKGWNMEEFEKMVEAVDLNFDGKVDFQEFELMMGENL